MNFIKRFLFVAIATMVVATLGALYLWGQISLSNYLAPICGEWIFAPVMILGFGIQMGLMITAGSPIMDKLLDTYKGIGREVQTAKA